MFTEKETQLIKFLLDYHLRTDVDFALSVDTANTARAIIAKINYCDKLNKKLKNV